MLGQGSLIKNAVLLITLVGALSACSSNRKKHDHRDKIASSSGLYCDFVNGDKHKEVELELNISMARKCDPEKPFSLTGYRNAAEVHGLMYCCSVKKAESSPKGQSSSDKKSSGSQNNKSDAAAVEEVSL